MHGKAPMADDTYLLHVDDDRLERYFADELSEVECESVERHLGVCLQCWRRVNASLQVTAALSSITPELHGEAYIRDARAAALRVAVDRARKGTAQAHWAERLARWELRDRPFTGGAARIKASARSVSVRVLVSAPPSSLAVQMEAPVRGDVEVDDLRPRCSVVADAEGIAVHLLGWSRDKPPLLLVVPVGEAGEPLIAEPQRTRTSEGERWTARVSATLRDREYLLEWEPLD